MNRRYVKNCVVAATCVVIAGVTGAFAQSESASTATTMQLERKLGERSLEKIADGSASLGVSRLQPPVASATRHTYLPALLLGGVVIALVSFGAGMLSVRRRPRLAANAAAPVQLWSGNDDLTAELQQRSDELAQQQDLARQATDQLDAIEVQHEQAAGLIRDERDAAQREVQALRLHKDDNELITAQQTIDDLRAEIEGLNSAQDDVDIQLRVTPPVAPDDLAAVLDSRQAHIAELEELLLGVRGERDAMEQHVAARETQLRALEQTLNHRDEELELAVADSQERSEQIRLLEQSKHDADQDRQALTAQNEQTAELQYQSAQLQTLVSSLEQDLSTHRDDAAQLEKELHDSREQLSGERLQVTHGAEQISVLQQSLEQAEQRIASLDTDLLAANEELDLTNRSPGDLSLQQDNQRLNELLAERERAVAEMGVEIAALSDQGDRMQGWTSTIASLENELRRKSTLIDEQSDNLIVEEDQIGTLQTEADNLRQELADGGREIESLHGLLTEARTLVIDLREELSQKEHEETRLRLAENPQQNPFSAHADAVDPWDADIETLQFTVRSRCDLADSLEAILAEERAALTSAEKRECERDDTRLALEKDIAANRVTLAAMHSRLRQARESGGVTPQPTQPLERELHENLGTLEALRSDLQKWRRRVKPLHDAVLLRDSRIRHLEAEIDALRKMRANKKLLVSATVVDDVREVLNDAQSNESDDDARAEHLQELELQWRRIVDLESELAATGLRLARAMEDENGRDRSVENLESARVAQASRIKQLHSEMSALGLQTDDHMLPANNIIDLIKHRP